MDYPKALSKKRTIEEEGQHIILFLFFVVLMPFPMRPLCLLSNEISFLSIDQLNERTNKEDLLLLSVCSFLLCFHRGIDAINRLYYIQTIRALLFQSSNKRLFSKYKTWERLQRRKKETKAKLRKTEKQRKFLFLSFNSVSIDAHSLSTVEMIHSFDRNPQTRWLTSRTRTSFPFFSKGHSKGDPHDTDNDWHSMNKNKLLQIDLLINISFFFVWGNFLFY